MPTINMCPSQEPSEKEKGPIGGRGQACLETLLVFAVFFLQGAWPAPEVNEPYYLGKAIHFWNPGWASGDLFLGTPDSHALFCLAVGWLGLWLSPTVMAWSLRLLTWGLLAWAWRRLSVAVLPRPWASILTATLAVFAIQRFNIAGEWLIGGAEAKGFAFVLVLLALEALVEGRWQRVWLLLGGASAFHVLLGGWSVVAAGAVWLRAVVSGQRSAASGQQPDARDKETRRQGDKGRSEVSVSPCLLVSLSAVAPALAGGLLLALPGLIPALRLDWGVEPAVARQAHVIYVYERLPHHLDPFQFPVDHVLAFLSLVVMWLALWPTTRGQPGVGRLRGFVNAAILVGLVGLAIRWLGMARPEAAAGLLRFYWFRLADVAVPLGVALVGVRWIVLARMPLARAVLVGLAVLHAADCLVMRLFSQTPLADRAIDGEAWQSAGRWLAGRAERPIFPRTPRADRLPDWRAWRAACEWVAHSGRIAPDARFLTPRQAQTFKWYAERGEVANWKEIPQDARSMVQWWQRIQDIYATGSTLPGARYSDWLLARTAESLRHLGAQYQADYLITVATGKRLPLPVEYKNRSYIIYRLGPPPS